MLKCVPQVSPVINHKNTQKPIRSTKYIDINKWYKYNKKDSKHKHLEGITTNTHHFLSYHRTLYWNKWYTPQKQYEEARNYKKLAKQNTVWKGKPKHHNSKIIFIHHRWLTFYQSIWSFNKMNIHSCLRNEHSNKISFIHITELFQYIYINTDIHEHDCLREENKRHTNVILSQNINISMHKYHLLHAVTVT